MVVPAPADPREQGLPEARRGGATGKRPLAARGGALDDGDEQPQRTSPSFAGPEELAAQGVRAVTFYSGRMASFPQLHRSGTSTGLTAGNIGGVD